MKSKLILTLLSGILILNAFGQNQGIPPRGTIVADQPTPPVDLPRFDLDFPGGSPKELVEAIREASGAALNVVLPLNQDEIQIPPLKMQQVNVFELFPALSRASQKLGTFQTSFTDIRRETRFPPRPGTSPPGFVTSQRELYTFQTQPPITPHSIWYLEIVSSKTPEVNIVRYYQLAPYLKQMKIEDITTAIQAGWKMLRMDSTPELNFHKDTQLLIAVGDPKKLEIIDEVLVELAKSSQEPSKNPLLQPEVQ